MKKIVILILIMFLFTGCKIKDINKDDIETFIGNSMLKSDLIINKSFKGYKFAVPSGFSIIEKKENNYILLSNGDYYYFYVDTVSYFYKKEIAIDENSSSYLYRKINYKGKNAYFQIINNKDDEYFVKIVYNYSKIEVKTNSKNLKHSIENSIGILISVDYNDIILKSLIGEDSLDYKEEAFTLFKSKRENGTFLDYIEEYESKKEKNIYKDDDFIE